MSTGTQIEVVMPQMGVSVSEGTITRWLKQPGEAVATDEALLEISTDKVDTEVPSPGEGVLTQILVQEGQTVEVGTVLAVIAPSGRGRAGTRRRRSRSRRSRSRSGRRRPLQRAPVPSPDLAASTTPSNGDHGRTFVSPVVARIAAEHGVDPSVIPGTGQGGRVTKKDILAFIESGPATPPPPPVAALAPTCQRSRPWPQRQPRRGTCCAGARGAPVAAAPPGRGSGGTGPLRLLPSGSARCCRRDRGADDGDAPRRDGSHAPVTRHVGARHERDRGRHVAGRRRPGGAQGRVPARATASTRPTSRSSPRRPSRRCVDWPWINGELRGEKIVSRSFVNLGIAVALDGGRGLIVPVIRNAQDLNLLGIARSIADLAERARTKKLLPDDVQGGTFTVTNPGGFGTFHGTPIINQPQVAILGTYALVKRPWVVQDSFGKDVIAIRPLMNITLTYDHRLVDGAYSGGFMRDLRERLEGWDGSA